MAGIFCLVFSANQIVRIVLFLWFETTFSYVHLFDNSLQNLVAYFKICDNIKIVKHWIRCSFLVVSSLQLTLGLPFLNLFII